MKQLVITFFTFFLLVVSAIPTFAADTYQYEGGCSSVGQCSSNKTCIVKSITRDDAGNATITVGPSDQPNCNSSSIGGVTPPTGVGRFDMLARIRNGSGEGQNIGIIIFISNLIKVFAIIAGIWAMFNLIMGGYVFITSGSDASAMEKVKNSITMTVIGLAIIAGAYTIAALIGALMFGDPTFILNPQLQGALQPAS